MFGLVQTIYWPVRRVGNSMREISGFIFLLLKVMKTHLWLHVCVVGGGVSPLGWCVNGKEE